MIIVVCTFQVNYSLGKPASSCTVSHSSRTANVAELCFAYVNIYSDNSLDSLSSLIMLSTKIYNIIINKLTIQYFR